MRENLIKSDAEYNRILENMRGVDFSGNKKSVDKRYAYLENMYRDYSAGGGDLIESVPGFRRIHSGTKINGLHLQTTQDGRRYLVINDGGKLYRCSADEPDSLTWLDAALLNDDTRSHAFNFGGRLYICDGYNFHAVEADGGISKVDNNTESSPHVPTVYMNGAEYEQRNLLSTMFYEKHYIDAIGKFVQGTPSLLYRVIDENKKLCHVCGSLSTPDVLHIPSQTLIGEQEYTVVGIDMGAFNGKKTIRIVRIADSVTTIGASAFINCSSLERVFCGSGVTEIRAYAFSGTSLEEIYLPGTIKRIGQGAIPTETTVKYELDADAYYLIDGAPRENVLYGAVIEFLDL